MKILLLGLAARIAMAQETSVKSVGCYSVPAGSVSVYESSGMMPTDCTARCTGSTLALIGPLTPWTFECVCLSGGYTEASGCIARCPGGMCTKKSNHINTNVIILETTASRPSSAPFCGGWDARLNPVWSAYPVPASPAPEKAPSPSPHPVTTDITPPGVDPLVPAATTVADDARSTSSSNSTQPSSDTLQAQPGGAPIPKPPSNSVPHSGSYPAIAPASSGSSSNQSAFIGGIVAAAVVLAVGFTVMTQKPRRRARFVNGMIVVGGEGSDVEGNVDNVQDLKTVVDFYYESQVQVVEVPDVEIEGEDGGGSKRRQSVIDYLQMPHLRNLLVGNVNGNGNGNNNNSNTIPEEDEGRMTTMEGITATTIPATNNLHQSPLEDMDAFGLDSQTSHSYTASIRQRSLISLDSALEFRQGSVSRFQVDITEIEEVMSTYEFDNEIMIEGEEAVVANVALARASMLLGSGEAVNEAGLQLTIQTPDILFDSVDDILLPSSISSVKETPIVSPAQISPNVGQVLFAFGILAAAIVGGLVAEYIAIQFLNNYHPKRILPPKKATWMIYSCVDPPTFTLPSATSSTSMAITQPEKISLETLESNHLFAAMDNTPNGIFSAMNATRLANVPDGHKVNALPKDNLQPNPIQLTANEYIEAPQEPNVNLDSRN
ncbi:UNVERIFIED_CONTAM: hypothetical protein HDU68_011456 [Siphonaria sp. JEL0065]|nr:hypothetical protein HDU68_011456 [Siphonaria sp. JEL0065]